MWLATYKSMARISEIGGVVSQAFRDLSKAADALVYCTSRIDDPAKGARELRKLENGGIILKKEDITLAFKTSVEKTMEPIPGQPDWYPINFHITVDDGPNLDSLGEILDVLDSFGVKATFFFEGAKIGRAMKAPERWKEFKPLVCRIVEGGHRIGYHSIWHCHSNEAAKNRKGCGGEVYVAFSRRKIRKDIEKFRELWSEAVKKAYAEDGFEAPAEEIYRISVGRHPGGAKNYPKRIMIVFHEEGITGPKLWHCDDFHPCFAGKRMGEIATDGRLLAAFMKQKVTDEKDFILLLHEKPDRAKIIEVILKAAKSSAFES